MAPAVTQRMAARAAITVAVFTLLATEVFADKEPHEESDEDVGVGTTKTKHSSDPPGKVGDPGFTHAFIASISVIVVSELGDKTFFIAAVMAMRHPRFMVFSGAILALVAMTILSALFGWVTIVIPRVYTYYISTLLFAIFGLRMLKEGYYMSPDEGQEELEEVQSDLKKKDDEMENEARAGDEETGELVGSVLPPTFRQKLVSCVPKVFLQALTLTFLAEWGDRSQLATIILAAREDVVGVTLGAALGHAFCTGLAVLGGRMIAQKISVKTVTLVGGVVFLVFAVSALFFDPEA